MQYLQFQIRQGSLTENNVTVGDTAAVGTHVELVDAAAADLQFCVGGAPQPGFSNLLGLSFAK